MVFGDRIYRTVINRKWPGLLTRGLEKPKLGGRVKMDVDEHIDTGTKCESYLNSGAAKLPAGHAGQSCFSAFQ